MEGRKRARIKRNGAFSFPVSVVSKPQNILYLRPDTFGDIVIFEPVLRALTEAWPDAIHTLLVRKGYETLAPLFSEKLIWRATELNPFKSGPAEGRALLTAVLSSLAEDPPDLIIAATLNRTWFEVALAAHFPQARRIALGQGKVDPLFANALRIEYGVTAAEVFTEVVPADETEQEWQSNQKLAEYLLGVEVPEAIPGLHVSKDISARAQAVLQRHQLQAWSWVAVFPAGIANVPLKAWPAQRFAEVAAWLQQKHQLQVMLLGHESETGVLDEVAHAMTELGMKAPPRWTGRDGEITLLAALLSTSKLYFGNDTGPMHLAAAVGRPVAAIFGGGHWPRFKPAARQAVSLIHPLPCFGCGWDCYFDGAPCIKTLTVADAKQAITHLIDAGEASINQIVEAQNISTESRDLIAAATPRYRKLQRDRLDRQHKIEELTHLDREKDVEIDDLKHEADAIKAELEAECAQKDREIEALKREADTKDHEITALKRETNTKDEEISSLKGEADTKDTEIVELKGEADIKDAEIERLKTVCNEREALIFKLTDIVKEFQAKVASLEGTLGHKETHIEQLTSAHDTLAAELGTLRTQFAALPPEASQYAQWLHDKDVHISNLEQAVATRDLQIRELQSTIENIHRGFGELEQIKRYDRWLHEKEQVIQHLKRVCDERETLIAQMAVQSAGLGRVRQIGLAFSAFVHQKLFRPVKDWMFRKVVEEYWMQLGILRHYGPRAIQWDKQLPKRGRLPDDRLPSIVIVTPSYNQEKFIESTMLSVLNQNYPKLSYGVQDGASKDRSPDIIRRYADRLAHWESSPDGGQASAVCRGFSLLPSSDDDIMAWLNSDDLIAPRALRFVAEYFARHPNVDVIYGNRIIIDGNDQEVGRWIMPRHDRATLEWIDYIPQETLFFRRRIWNAVGGLDPSYQFALDWDLLARFQQAGARIVRLPYFLGCFRVHSEQKTSAHIHTTGHEEMTRIRTRIHGPNPDPVRIEHYARKARFSAALTARLHDWGLRF